MLSYEELNKTQQGLYDKLKTTIRNQDNINDLYEDISCAIYEDIPAKEDWEQVLTHVKCVNCDDQEHTLTLLGFVINQKQQESIQGILDVAKRNSILEKILTTANIKIKFSNGQEITLTPLAYAIILNNQIGIDTILNIAKKDKELLEKVLTAANIKIRPSGNHEYTLTPLTYAINLTNQEASHKSIEAILDAAKNDNMLEKVFASVRKDYLNKTKKILEILKNQEQDEKEKTKIDGWLEVLAKSISSCESKDDLNKITMHDRVQEIFKKQEQEDWKVTLERIVPNHKNKDICDVLKEILDPSSKDPQQIADRLTVLKKIMSGCEIQEQSSVAESSVPKTEGNITDESSTSEISIMPDCESNEQSSMAESIVPKTEGNITDESSTSEIENSKQKDKVKTTNKPIIIGCVYGAIAALATGGGCFAAGVVALPILALIGIAIAAAVVVGLIAGGITYVISKPSENLDRANVEQRVSIGLTA